MPDLVNLIKGKCSFDPEIRASLIHRIFPRRFNALLKQSERLNWFGLAIYIWDAILFPVYKQLLRLSMIKSVPKVGVFLDRVYSSNRLEGFRILKPVEVVVVLSHHFV
jgi:hypothetical protein